MKKIFDLGDRADGLSNYNFDVVKILFEDKEFFNEVIDCIDPNDFVDGLARRTVFEMKDYHRGFHIHPSMDTIMINIVNSLPNEFEAEMFKEYFKRINERYLDSDRIAEVKSTILYYNVFANICRLRNNIDDALNRGMSLNDLMKLYDVTMTYAERVRLSKERLDYNLCETNNDWSDDE